MGWVACMSCFQADAWCHQMKLKRQGYAQVTVILAANIIPISVRCMKVREVFSSKVEFQKKSQLMWTNHLFHRYNWCHVIDINIIVQLCMMVGPGIKLKSMSVRSWRWTSLHLPWNPCIAVRVLLKRANLSSVLVHIMTDAYGCLRSLAIFSASLLLTLVDSGAIPPLVVKTRGLNEDFSMSITLWLYLSFSFSCCWYR